MTLTARLLLVFLCCFWSLPSFSQEKSVLPAPKIADISYYGLGEGLPVNCVSGGFQDSKGRLWLNPCSYIQEEEGPSFFQYDGTQATFYDIALTGIQETTNTPSWSVYGENAQGYLFGIDEFQPLAFLWHPDTRKEHIFSFPGETIWNILAAPNGALLALTIKDNSYQVYRLKGQEKNLLGTITLEFDKTEEPVFSKSFILSNQKVWFFHEYKGLVFMDLRDGTMQLLPWTELTEEKISAPQPDDFINWRSNSKIFPHVGDNLLVFLGKQNGLFQLDLPSLKLSPRKDLNDWLMEKTTPIGKSIHLTQDTEQNVLINFIPSRDNEDIIPNDIELATQSFLLDTQGQLYDYSNIIQEMKASAPQGYLPSWAGSFFGNDFKSQFGWASFGGLVMVDLQLDLQIKTYPLNQGTRAIQYFNDQYAVVNTDSRTYFLNLETSAYSFLWKYSLKIGSQTSMNIDKTQNLWGANSFDKLLRFDLKQNQFENYDIGVTFDKFVFLNEDEIAFFSMEGQLFFYNIKKGQVEQYSYQSTPFTINSLVNEVYLLPDKILWVAAKNGLWRIDLTTNEVRHLDQKQGLTNLHVLCVNLGRDGTIWAGTAGDGVFVFDSNYQLITQIKEAQGLSNNTVPGILTDEENNRWIATYNGLSVFTPSGKALFELTQENGLTNNEFNRLSYTKFPDGRLAFGGVFGINILDPQQILKAYAQRIVPTIFLTKLEYYDDNQEENQVYKGSFYREEPIRIPAANRYISLDFALSDYIATDQQAFFFRIIPAKTKEKNDETLWNELGPVSKLTLNNLPVGNWVIQIKGIDHKGTQIEVPLEIPIEVAEFFYRTWWFYVLCSLPLIIGGWIWIRYILSERQRLKVEVAKRTERIEQDKEIIARQVQELQQFDQVKSRFFANISHELRTPLTIILGMADQIEKQPNRWLSDGTKMIRNNGTNLLDLVNQILDLQKLESGKLKVKLQLNDIIPFLRSIFNQFQALGQSKQLDLEFTTTEASILMDYDQQKILRIVSNLLSNAIKYTPENGQVTFSISEGINPKLAPPRCLILSVQDTGQGIPTEELPHIFDRFFQATAPDKISNMGTGIGLSLTQELVHLLNGRIEVSSEIGHGTTFQVYLPITQLAAPGQPHNPVDIQASIFGTAGPLKNEKTPKQDLPVALIVEDNPDIAQYLQICLEGHYQTEFAINGQEGIDQALEQIPDIIVSDVMMPIKDGFELCETLKADIRTSHIPIILLTAKSDVESRIAGLKQGADDYLAKPFHEEELLVRMQNLLNIRQKLQERYQDVYAALPKKEEEQTSKEDEFILKLKEVFEPRMDDPQFDLNALSKELHLSRSQLGRKVKALTGKSPAVFLRSLRLQKGRQLLLTTDLTIKEIAYDIGFADPDYFTRTYSEEFAEPPSKTRE